MNESVEADHKIVSKGEESMTSKWERVETEGLGRAMRERQSRGGGRDNVEKNQAKRTHARCGDKQKVRESGETEGRERA